MKTQKNKLVFGKNELIELNDSQIAGIVGGSPSLGGIKELISDCFTITDRFKL